MDAAFDEFVRTLRALERLSRPEERAFPPYFGVGERHIAHARAMLEAYGEDRLLERVARLLVERGDPLAVFNLRARCCGD